MSNYEKVLRGLLPSTSFLRCALLSCVMIACAASDGEIRKAQRAGYQTDFATVYGEALAAVVDQYPRTIENAATGIIKTAWHPVAGRTGRARQSSQPIQVGGATNQPTNQLTGRPQSDNKAFYIRLRVHVFGGKPWRVRVEAEAAEWATGDVPMPLRGAETPPWLKGRINAMQVAIYRRLKKHAIEIEVVNDTEVQQVAVVEAPESFGDIPEEAQALITQCYKAVEGRRFDTLRTLMAQDTEWAEGEPGDADVALAVWQADTQRLEAFTKILESGCTASASETQVECTGEGYMARFEKRGNGWKLVGFR